MKKVLAVEKGLLLFVLLLKKCYHGLIVIKLYIWSEHVVENPWETRELSSGIQSVQKSHFIAITLGCSSVLGIVIIIKVECWGFGFKCIPKVGIWIWTRGFVQTSQGLTLWPRETAFFYRPPSCPSQKKTDCQTFCRIITAERKRAVSARLCGTSAFLSL